MTIKVIITHDKTDFTRADLEEFRAKAKPALREAADMLLGDVKRRLSTKREGPALEGEPPGMVTGKLMRSYRRMAVRVKGTVVSSGIISKHEGANRLEFGATDSRGVRTLPHPHVRPAIAAMEEPVTKLLQQRLGGSER